MTFVKICGIGNVDDARCATDAGADFLGFIFYPPSPRFVTVEQAAIITQATRDRFGRSLPRFVGVFVDEPVERVRAVLDGAGLDLAQLCGSESPAEVRALAPRAFKAIRPQALADGEEIAVAYDDVILDDEALPQLLLDAYVADRFGGTGVAADLSTARMLASQYRLMLAGGLTPENVGSAIEQARPWGVDVSSGVERAKGLKDHERIRAFIAAVHAADL